MVILSIYMSHTHFFIVLSLYYNQMYLLTGPGGNHAAFDYLVFTHFSEKINKLMSLITIIFFLSNIPFHLTM